MLPPPHHHPDQRPQRDQQHQGGFGGLGGPEHQAREDRLAPGRLTQPPPKRVPGRHPQAGRMSIGRHQTSVSQNKRFSRPKRRGGQPRRRAVKQLPAPPVTNPRADQRQRDDRQPRQPQQHDAAWSIGIHKIATDGKDRPRPDALIHPRPITLITNRRNRHRGKRADQRRIDPVKGKITGGPVMQPRGQVRRFVECRAVPPGPTDQQRRL